MISEVNDPNSSASGNEAAAPAPAGDQDVAQSPPGNERTQLIVGIGASAGGIPALITFFERVPADIGMAFIIVQHLDPDYKTSLPSIIAGHAKLPVLVAENGSPVKSNHVYVIPPNAILTIKEARLCLLFPAPAVARRTSINTFLRSLAEDQGENAVGIILSGFGTDGALGMAAIKENGGVTFSQADFDHHAKEGMPQSAASSGFVDHVLAVEEMPKALVDYRHHRQVCDSHKDGDGIRQDLPSHLASICAILHSRLGRDFTGYKAGTLMRRIQRRMHVLQTDEVADYVNQLRSRPHEAEDLFRELLISVTRFFRDRETFEVLEAGIIPELIAGNTTIRVWVPGCATGEEVYSLAILLNEARLRLDSHCSVQIFATDLDDRAIVVARAGLYPGTIAADVSPERLTRNFMKEDGNYRVTKDIRDMCLFSVHDLVKDPPFSRIDLVSCRNLLIYFEPQLQRRVTATFHYALRPGRYLLLGPSETIPSGNQLFASIEKHHRLYARRDVATVPLTLPRTRAPGEMPAKRSGAPIADDVDRRAARVIARYAPAFLVVNRHYDILRFSGETGKYLQPATGAASLHLFNLLHTDLRGVARSALREASTTGTRVINDGVSVELGGRFDTVNVIVEPLPGNDDSGLFIIAFQEATAPGTAAARQPVPDESEELNAAETLNRELLTTRERLRSMSEELEAANEELQSSNEEYLSVNEELQSANEELETSKEELQSLNEELQTINAELNNRNESLVRSNSDLVNLFDSTAIATLFLDREMRIRRFTPPLLEIFSLREGDEGRPITDIVTRLTEDGLRDDVRQVLRTLKPRKREVAIGEGMSFLMQVRPYRDINNVIDGVVITFVDLSEQKRHEQAQARLAAIVESSQDAIVGHDLVGTVISWNNGAEQLFSIPASEAVGQAMPAMVRSVLPWTWSDMLARLERAEQLTIFECEGATSSGEPIEISVTISPVRDADRRLTGVSLVARDIRARKDAERKAALLLGELDHRVKNILSIVSAIISQTLRNAASPEDFGKEVEGRIRAIAAAHSLLTNAGAGEISLRAILQTELAPFNTGDGNLVIRGQDLALTPKAGLALAMAVHELASNAVKYGALSTNAGKLSIEWQSSNDRVVPAIVFVWEETGGPAVSPPARRGFGTTMIERALAHELDAEVSRDFMAIGLRCTITIPLTAEVGRLLPTRDKGAS